MARGLISVTRPAVLTLHLANRVVLFSLSSISFQRGTYKNFVSIRGIGGLQVMSLHSFEHEHVALVAWPENERFQAHRHFGGEEILVLSGEFQDEHGAYPAGSWVRSPHMSQHFPFVEQATVILVKTGHLPLGSG